MHTNEVSLSSLNVAYLTDANTTWTSSQGVSDYLSQYYEIPTNEPMLSRSDNGKSIALDPIAGARWVTLEGLLGQ